MGGGCGKDLQKVMVRGGKEPQIVDDESVFRFAGQIARQIPRRVVEDHLRGGITQRGKFLLSPSRCGIVHHQEEGRRVDPTARGDSAEGVIFISGADGIFAVVIGPHGVPGGHAGETLLGVGDMADNPTGEAAVGGPSIAVGHELCLPFFVVVAVPLLEFRIHDPLGIGVVRGRIVFAEGPPGPDAEGVGGVVFQLVDVQVILPVRHGGLLGIGGVGIGEEHPPTSFVDSQIVVPCGEVSFVEIGVVSPPVVLPVGISRIAGYLVPFPGQAGGAVTEVDVHVEPADLAVGFPHFDVRIDDAGVRSFRRSRAERAAEETGVAAAVDGEGMEDPLDTLRVGAETAAQGAVESPVVDGDVLLGAVLVGDELLAPEAVVLRGLGVGAHVADGDVGRCRSVDNALCSAHNADNGAFAGHSAVEIHWRTQSVSVVPRDRDLS